MFIGIHFIIQNRVASMNVCQTYSEHDEVPREGVNVVVTDASILFMDRLHHQLFYRCVELWHLKIVNFVLLIHITN